METLKIQLFTAGSTKPESTITLPLQVTKHGKKMMPTKIKAVLKTGGIDINQLAELAEKKIPKGRLIEVENVKERIVISVG